MHLLRKGVNNWDFKKFLMLWGCLEVQGFGVQGNTNFGVYEGKTRFSVFAGKKRSIVSKV
jgi:hypothetical protein